MLQKDIDLIFKKGYKKMKVHIHDTSELNSKKYKRIYVHPDRCKSSGYATYKNHSLLIFDSFNRVDANIMIKFNDIIVNGLIKKFIHTVFGQNHLDAYILNLPKNISNTDLSLLSVYINTKLLVDNPNAKVLIYTDNESIYEHFN